MDRALAVYRRAHVSICVAGLPPSTAVVANELLAMADLATGQVNVQWEVLLLISGCLNVNAARRHLSRLAAVGLIHYSTNDFVYVTWLEWMLGAPDLRVGAPDLRVGAPDLRVEGAWRSRCRDAEVVEDRLFGPVDAPDLRVGAPNLRVGAPNLRVGAPNLRVGAPVTHTRVSVSLLSDPPCFSSGSFSELTDLRAKAEQRRSVDLLMDEEVGLDREAAWRFAKCLGFDEICRQVMTWQRQMRAGIVDGPGALVHRMAEGYGAVVTEQDRGSELYRRHHPQWREEERRERHRAYCPDEYRDVIIGGESDEQ